MTSFFTGKLWQIATGVAAVLVLVMGFFLTTSYWQNRELSKQRNVLTAQINDPKTGYIAQLAQSRTNEATLEAEVDRQNAAYDKLSAESTAALRRAEARLAEAQAETRRLEIKVAGFLATKPQGATIAERVQDIDERAMKEFLP